MPTIINSTQPSPRGLQLNEYDFYAYVQFGKGVKIKRRPRVVVNLVRGLRNTRNKPRQMQLLSEAGLRVPQQFPELITACNHIREGGKVVGKRLNHSRGRGIMLFEDPDELWEFGRANHGRYYFQEYRDMNREWRIHVSRFHEEPVCAYRKCFRGEVVEAYRAEEIEKPWVRNLENCYFKLDGVDEDKEPWFDDMVYECRRALEVLDMDIAGVDVGENNKVDGGDFVIYEVNSACGMDEHTRTSYEQAINEIIEIKARRKGLL